MANNPNMCPSRYYMALPRSWGWGCRCCKTVDTLPDHRYWNIYKMTPAVEPPTTTTTTTTMQPTENPVVPPPVDNYGEECWTSFGCWGDKGTVCDGCGLHDGKEMLCCRDNWGNHKNCNGAVFDPSATGHHCVYIDESAIQPEDDHYGEECWGAFGCWGDKGTVCDGCGSHDGKEMLCCRPGWHNHPNCNGAAFKGTRTSHQCVYIGDTLQQQNWSFDLLEASSGKVILNGLAVVGLLSVLYKIVSGWSSNYKLISDAAEEEI